MKTGKDKSEKPAAHDSRREQKTNKEEPNPNRDDMLGENAGGNFPEGSVENENRSSTSTDEKRGINKSGKRDVKKPADESTGTIYGSDAEDVKNVAGFPADDKRE